jgi:hypothetical protein
MPKVGWVLVNRRIILDIIEEEAGRLHPELKVEAEIEALPKTNGLAAPEVVKNWIADHLPGEAKLGELADEYQRMSTTGSMKNPNLIPDDRQMKVH